ncbi:hypothetical protein DSECCO2_594650 [anaerobic digester metagenome]
MKPGLDTRFRMENPVTDLPAPDSPTRPRRSPLARVNETSLTAVSAVSRSANLTVRLDTSSSGCMD